jgi:hypothetical protein
LCCYEPSDLHSWSHLFQAREIATRSLRAGKPYKSYLLKEKAKQREYRERGRNSQQVPHKIPIAALFKPVVCPVVGCVAHVTTAKNHEQHQAAHRRDAKARSKRMKATE